MRLIEVLAFKREAKANPNYGKANGLNAEKWWTNVKHTFSIFNSVTVLIHYGTDYQKHVPTACW